MGQGKLPVAERVPGAALVKWGMVSGTHQGGVSGVYQVNEDLVLEPVLRLEPLSKRLRAHRE